MKLSTAIMTFILAIVSFVVMLNIKSDVKLLSIERKELLYQQRNLKRDIRVQQAEFAHLTSPERLQEFAIKYGMEEVSSAQLISFPKVDDKSSGGMP